jgi:hypothetical protein
MILVAAIAYFIPRNGYFQVAFVFGKKAVEQVLAGDISQAIKTELEQARVYAEGRGVRIDVRDDGIVDDIKRLVIIKLSN